MTWPGVPPAWAGRALALSASLWFGTAAAASGGRLGGGEDLGVSLWRILVALIICSMVALLAALLIRQRAGKQDLRALFGRFELRGRKIEVVETRRLSQHADICLVRHDGREYLLLLMAGATQVLSETAAVPETADPPCE